MMKLKLLFLIFTVLAIFMFSCSGKEDIDNIPDPGNEEEEVDPNDKLPLLKTLTVMTYNIHSCNPPSKPNECDIDAIVQTIKKANADIVFLQEVDKNTGRNGNYADQAAEIGEKVGMNAQFFSARIQGKGFYGEAILSKYKIEDVKSHLLPQEVSLEQRILGTVTIKLTSKEKIVAAVTHLQHNSQENRLDQIREIVRILSAENLPVILGGDFNEKTTAIEFFDTFDTAFKRTCIDYSCPYTFPAANPSSMIDYIAFKPETAFKANAHKTINETYASDHLPVVATLEFQR